MKHLYFDMDGVLANFDKAFLEWYGVSGLSNVEQLINDPDIAEAYWNRDVHSNRFFSTLEPVKTGIQLFFDVKELGYNPCIMTSTGGGRYHNEIAIQKIDWLAAQGIRDIPMAFCMNTVGKGAFAQPAAILIDDRQSVLDEWTNRGGIGVQFCQHTSNVNFKLEQIKKLMELG